MMFVWVFHAHPATWRGQLPSKYGLGEYDTAVPPPQSWEVRGPALVRRAEQAAAALSSFVEVHAVARARRLTNRRT